MSWWNDIVARIFPPASTGDPLVDLIASNNTPMGPLGRTGGVIHQNPPAMNATIAALLRSEVPKWPMLTIALVVAWLVEESRCDPLAWNPNNQVAKPGETAAAAFLHADVGLAQFDGATLALMPEFRGMAWQDILAKANDPTWAVPAFCAYANSLIADAIARCEADDTLLDGIPARDPRALGVEGYNVGRTGAWLLARKKTGSWKYATDILGRADTFAKTLGG